MINDSSIWKGKKLSTIFYKSVETPFNAKEIFSLQKNNYFSVFLHL